MTRRFIMLAVLAVGVGSLTCKDATSGPTPGYLDVRMASPNVDDGGLSFVVSGADIDSITTPFPVLATQQAGDSSWSVVVGGNIGTGVVAKIWVPDTKRVHDYAATVLEVVVRTTYAQRSNTGYAVIVATP